MWFHVIAFPVQPLAARQLDTHAAEAVAKEKDEEEEEGEEEIEEEEKEEEEEEEEEEEGRILANGRINASSDHVVASQALGEPVCCGCGLLVLCYRVPFVSKLAF